MKTKKTLIIVMLVMTMFLTGCTSYLKDDKKAVVKNPETGQNIVKNILCKTENEVNSDIYDKYKVDLSKVPECKNYNPAKGKYEGIWNSIFVKPLAWLIIKVGYLVKNFGLAIILITLAIRLLLVPFTKKAAMQSENMKLVKPELDKLERKYKGKDDQESMMQKSQEMLMLYKKYNINPAAGCVFSLIQLPLFIAFYEALYRLPVVFEGKFLVFDLGFSPLAAIMSGKIYYIILVILVVIVTHFSFKLNAGASMGEAQASQMKMMRYVTIVMIGFASFQVSVAIALYWITNSGFTVLQNLIVKKESAINVRR